MKRLMWLVVAASVVAALIYSAGRRGRSAPPVIYWFTIDALRADVIGQKYGDKVIMPNLTAFAQESAYFDNAYSQSSFTKISTAAMFTGLWPSRLGVKGCQVKVAPAGMELCFGLDPRFPTLAGFLGDHGYRALTHPYTTHVRKGDGLVNGFEMLDSIPDTLPGGPLFVYQHILGLHAPYVPSEAALDHLGVRKADLIDPGDISKFFEPITSEQAEELRSYYFAEGYDADLQFQQLKERLRAQGAWDEALVIVTADHGEEFIEHGGLQHSVQLYNEVLRVPLFVKFPKSSPLSASHGKRFANRVRLVDLLPTIKELVGGDNDSSLDGQSLLPIVRGEESAQRQRDVVAQVAGVQDDQGSLVVYEARAIIMHQWKALMGYRMAPGRNRTGPRYARGEVVRELYDLSSDPMEAQNQVSANEGIYKAMESEYWRRAKPVRYLERGGKIGLLNALSEAAPDREDRERELRALGYIQ